MNAIWNVMLCGMYRPFQKNCYKLKCVEYYSEELHPAVRCPAQDLAMNWNICSNLHNYTALSGIFSEG